VSEKKNRQPVGSLKISEDVIATIASVAAQEINGVAIITQPSTGRQLFRQFGKKPIDVVLSDDFVDIDISINLEFGVKIAETCTSVQSTIKDNIQTMTGMAVGKVNVLVSGIIFPGDKQDA